MSGKLIQNLKRKREESVAAGSSSDSSDLESCNDNKREKLCERENSRPDLDNPVKSSENEDYNKTQSDKSAFLLEALKKVVELQKELEEIGGEDDDDGGDEEFYNSDDSDSYYSHGYTRNYEAEALGFAVCARETLLFLQKEGISQDSTIYRTLKDRLVAGSQGIPI